MKMFIVIVILLSLFIFLNFLYKKTNHYRNNISQLGKYLKGVPKDLEVVNTGSSYAKYAFDYRYTSLRGFNFGLQPQSLSYDFRILKQYTPNLQEGCIVLITLPNLVFGFLDYENDNSNTKYYYFLESENILGYSKFKHLVAVAFPLLSSKNNIFRIIKDVPLNTSYNQDGNLMTEEQVHNNALSRVEGWKKQFNLSNTTYSNAPNELEKEFEDTISLLNEMLEYCFNKGLKPAIIVPPTSSIINDLLSKEFMQRVLYDNIEKANQGRVHVLDYLYDDRFQDYRLYINSDMLNRKGREKFTKVVMGDLEKIDFLKGENHEEI